MIWFSNAWIAYCRFLRSENIFLDMIQLKTNASGPNSSNFFSLSECYKQIENDSSKFYNFGIQKVKCQTKGLSFLQHGNIDEIKVKI